MPRWLLTDARGWHSQTKYLSPLSLGRGGCKQTPGLGGSQSERLSHPITRPRWLLADAWGWQSQIKRLSPTNL